MTMKDTSSDSRSQSKQRTFDIVARHLLEQKKKSFVINFGDVRAYRYRGPNNLKCAGGILIPDDQYTPDLEGHGVKDELIANILKGCGHDIDLVDDLQDVHDGYEVEEWLLELEGVAEDHELEMTCLGQ